LQSGGNSRLAMHASLRRQLLHLASDLAELVENPRDLPHGFDLLTRSSTTSGALGTAAATIRSDR
jgi:hypothetical protein